MYSEVMKNYFKGSQNTDVWISVSMFIVGALFFFTGHTIGYVLAIVLIILSIVTMIYFLKEQHITDEDIDQFCLDNINGIEDKSLKKLGLDKEQVSLISPIVISGYFFSKILTDPFYRQGLDQKDRSSNYQVSVLFFSDDQVFSYTYTFSLIYDEEKSRTDEYFYKDIVSISTSNDIVDFIDNRRQKKSANIHQFVLTTSGGTSICNSLMSYDDNIEKSIQGMKQLIRQKKQV